MEQLKEKEEEVKHLNECLEVQRKNETTWTRKGA